MQAPRLLHRGNGGKVSCGSANTCNLRWDRSLWPEKLCSLSMEKLPVVFSLPLALPTWPPWQSSRRNRKCETEVETIASDVYPGDQEGNGRGWALECHRDYGEGKSWRNFVGGSHKIEYELLGSRLSCAGMDLTSVSIAKFWDVN